jgi:hypothetical protein
MVHDVHDEIATHTQNIKPYYDCLFKRMLDILGSCKIFAAFKDENLNQVFLAFTVPANLAHQKINSNMSNL